MLDPRAAKLKMLEELSQYANGALKNKVMGGVGGAAEEPRASDGAPAGVSVPLTNAPVPGAEEAAELPAMEASEGSPGEAAEGGGQLDEHALHELLAMLQGQGQGA